jgi:putative endopeptidase
MDRSVRPGVDFDAYANGAWMKTAEIPADRSATGPAVRLIELSQQRTKAILDDLAGDASATGDARKAGDYYAAFMNEAAVEKAGTKPLAAPLAAIAKIGDRRALARALGASLRADVDMLNASHLHTPRLFGLWVEEDMNDPSRTAGYLIQGGLGMPDRGYYVDDSPKMAALRAKYEAHLASVFKLAGLAKPEARAARVVALEKKIAAAHASVTESKDVKKANNPWTKADFTAKAPGLDWRTFFASAGLDGQASLVVWQPAAVTGLSALAASEPLDAWKDWLAAHAIDDESPYLAKAFADEHYAFYETALHGVPEQPARWKRAVAATNDALGDAVGKVYAARHFPAERKAAIGQMVAAIKAAFARRIDALTWMAPQTKAGAKAKLATLIVGIGYPDSWRDYSDFKVTRDDAAGNHDRAAQWLYAQALARLGKAPDRAGWELLPQTVNALNLPIRNALNFPAAFLEPPFFVAGATAAVNYGAIGTVIGHEISHSFDDEGATFDATGKLANWWTPDDLAHFEQSCAALATQFDAYHPFPDVAVNGKQTLGENIADLGGLAAAYDAWKASLGGQRAPVAEGLTGDQQFFASYAQAHQSKIRDAALRARLATDTHAPPKYRTLTVRNIDAWYAAFDVQPGDPLYLAPDARVRVW